MEKYYKLNELDWKLFGEKLDREKPGVVLKVLKEEVKKEDARQIQMRPGKVITVQGSQASSMTCSSVASGFLSRGQMVFMTKPEYDYFIKESDLEEMREDE